MGRERLVHFLSHATVFGADAMRMRGGCVTQTERSVTAVVLTPIGNLLRLPSNPHPLDFLLGDLLVAVVIDPGCVRGGVPGNVLSDL